MSFRHKQSTCCNVTCPGAVREKSLGPVPKQAHHAGPRLIRLIDYQFVHRHRCRHFHLQ